MKNIFRSAHWIAFDFRCVLGMWFLRQACAVLPRSFSIREGVMRGMSEQIEYDRYAGYTRICGEEPWAFDKWRETWRILKFLRPEPRKTARELRGYRPQASARA